ncbi:hypothetical protein [Flavobacterium sp. N3904]|uniref:hypothetical protein n=1 Tax=Flavobacterium sp. N3904 TaxID=2986835 RepID=UPI0022247AC8|nr:hypothetical protein [Flavobacterium sp. N3904]
MSKSIFILFLFFCSLYSFSQKGSSNSIINSDDFSGIKNELKKEKIEVVKVQQSNEKEIVLIYTGNLCDLSTIKVSDLLNESMLKKLLANV